MNKSIKKSIKLFLGLILFVWLSYSLYHQIRNQEGLQKAVRELALTWSVEKVIWVVVVFVLMFFNWALESMKWRMLLKHTENISFYRSFQSVLTGLSISLITPNRIGEYLGRILFLKNVNKVKGISLTLIGSFAQLMITSFFGVLGSLYYIYSVKGERFEWVLLFIGVTFCILLMVLLFNLRALVDWMERRGGGGRLKTYIKVVTRFNKKTLWKVIAYSTTRYLIYSTQFYILLRVSLGAFLPLSAYWLIFLVFWAIAVVPAVMAIADIGIRGQTAVTFLSVASSNILGILSASILLWAINLIIPAFIGSLFIFRMKLFDSDQ